MEDLHALQQIEGMGNQALLPQGVRAPVLVLGPLPDAAGVGGHHWLAGLAAEGLAELRHVLHDAVHAKLSG